MKQNRFALRRCSAAVLFFSTIFISGCSQKYGLEVNGGAKSQLEPNGNASLVTTPQSGPVVTKVNHYFVYSSVKSPSQGLAGYEFDPASGTLAPLASGVTGLPVLPHRLAFTASGSYLYVIGFSPQGGAAAGQIFAFSVNPVTGALAFPAQWDPKLGIHVT